MTNGQRRAIFEFCRKLGMDDDARRAMAGSFRRDGIESTRGMDVRQAGEMIVHLKEMWRQRQLKRHRRIDENPKSEIRNPAIKEYASERWRYFVAEQAKSLFGEKWEAELDLVIARHNGGMLIPWHSPCMPKGVFREVSEEIKSRVGRASGKSEIRNPKLGGG